MAINMSPRPVTVHGHDSDKWLENQKYTSRNTDTSVKMKDKVLLI